MDATPHITIDTCVVLETPNNKGASGKEFLTGLVSKFDKGEWSDAPFRMFVWRNLKTACLTPSESSVIVGDPDEKLRYAAMRLRRETPNSKSRGSEIAEICLYGILKEFYGCCVAISKIFHKQNRNDTVKGADSVHFRVDNDGRVSYWYGEAKFYKKITAKTIEVAVNSVADIFDEEKMAHENSLVVTSTDLGDSLCNNSLADHIRQSFSDGLMGALKRNLHVPILLLYEYEAGHMPDEVLFREKIKEHQETLAKLYYAEHIQKLCTLSYYSDIHFHLFLFPIPNKKKVVDLFVCEAEGVENGALVDFPHDDVFASCQEVSAMVDSGDIVSARIGLIRLLDKYGKDICDNIAVNHLMRVTGLFNYMGANGGYVDSLMRYAFIQDVGGGKESVFHKDQARVLRLLIEGRDLIVSAPTSFGKSFIIDAYIAIMRPKTIAIIVPTLALTDEARRRLMRKFGDQYIIRTDSEVCEGKVIYVFPQERALKLAEHAVAFDFLVVDEFYKIDPEYDKERAGTLFEAMLRLLPRAKLCYCLAPYIDQFQMGLTPAIDRDWTILILRNPTVVQEEFDFVAKLEAQYEKPAERDVAKKRMLRETIKSIAAQKNIIYVGAHRELWKYAEDIRRIQLDEAIDNSSDILANFADWLQHYYTEWWYLPQNVNRGIGIHNGRMHRTICMLQLRLFDTVSEFHFIISTTSIVEGVNTSAKNVLVCSHKKGPSNLDSLTFKNIKGRAGRMSMHYIGNVYLFDKPAKVNSAEIVDLSPTRQDVLPLLSEDVNIPLDAADLERVEEEKQLLVDSLGEDLYRHIVASGKIRRMRSKRLISLVDTLRKDMALVASLRELMQFSAPQKWVAPLTNIQKPIGFFLECCPKIGGNYSAFARNVVALSYNWTQTVRNVLNNFYPCTDMPIEHYFDVERNMSFKFAGLMADLNVVVRSMYPAMHIDLNEWVWRASNAFLPHTVYQLEEMGLPRMLSRKIQSENLFDFERAGITLADALRFFNGTNTAEILAKIHSTHPFDTYVLNYFYEGLPRR